MRRLSKEELGDGIVRIEFETDKGPVVTEIPVPGAADVFGARWAGKGRQALLVVEVPDERSFPWAGR